MFVSYENENENDATSASRRLSFVKSELSGDGGESFEVKGGGTSYV
jgi:hypothetical protein